MGVGAEPSAPRRKLMSNRAIWSVRQRHEWLATPLKKKRVKKCQRKRIGLEAALQRKQASAGGDAKAQAAAPKA